MDIQIDAEKKKALQEKIDEFRNLLKDFEIDEKIKKLWLEIYANASWDRLIAQEFKIYAFSVIVDDPDKHKDIGGHMAKYMDIGIKANDQLIKLNNQILDMFDVDDESVDVGEKMTNIFNEASLDE